MKGTVVKYGLSGGLFMSIMFALSVVIAGDPPNYTVMQAIGYISIILALLAVFLGIKSYRDRELGGVISFSKGFGVGVGIAAIASLILGLYTFAHIAWLDPNFEENYSAWAIENVQTSDMSQVEKAAEIENIQEMLKNTNSPFMQGIIMYATVFVMGLLIALIAAAILKKAEPESALT